jgi:23S rRNA-/tRNA-specific pseudouridylate synthase
MNTRNPQSQQQPQPPPPPPPPPPSTTTTTSRYLVARGIRYVVPYLHEQSYSVRQPHAGKSVVQVLSLALGRQHLSSDALDAYFRRQVLHGRIGLRRSKTHKADTGPFTCCCTVDGGAANSISPAFQTVLDPDMITAPKDRLHILQHVHERCTIYRGPLTTIPCCTGASASASASTVNDNDNDNDDQQQQQQEEYYRAVFKPAGLPVINGEGECRGCVAGLIRDDGSWHLGHRLDLSVSGILLLGKGKGRAGKLLKALSPDEKQKKTKGQNGQGGNAVLKAYLARVRGGEWLNNNDSETNNTNDNTNGNSIPSALQEVRCKLKWDNRAKKALVVTDNDDDDNDDDDDDNKNKNKARNTITLVQRLKWDAKTRESLVRVELVTGARQQVRAVLASMGLPIVGDTKYGGGAPVAVVDTPEDNDHDELSLYADDREGRLLKMLVREQVDWCDKCRWQIEEAKNGGTRRGAEELADTICLLSYHYRIPSLGIDAQVPDDMLPEWAIM